MFHLVLILFPLLILVIIGSVLLFGITTVIAGIIGGASVAVYIKNKRVKQLLLIGFCILLFIGSLCLISTLGLFLGLTAELFSILFYIILAFIIILAIAGIIISISINNKIGMTILIFIFATVCAIALLFVVLGIALPLK